MPERRVPSDAELHAAEVSAIAALMANPQQRTVYLFDGGVDPQPVSPVVDGRLSGGDRP
jgi:hypothetical protein